MNWKQIFCRHEWVRTRMKHDFATDGYILNTYHLMVCKKCGKQFETRFKENYKYEDAETVTSNLEYERMKGILNGTWWR